MKKILIFGSSGQLGSQLINLLKDDYELIKISHKDLDFNKFYLIEDIILKNNPDIIINCAALTDVDRCEIYKNEAYNVNAGAVRHIIRPLKVTESYFINISTDYVFNGITGNYREDDLPDPVNYYGLTKLLGDIYANSYDNTLIIRTSGVFLNKGFPVFVYKNLMENKRVTAIPGYYSPISAFNLAMAIKDIIPLNRTGILNIAGNKISRYDLALRISEMYNLNKNIDENNIELKAKRPFDSSLNIERAKKLINFNFYDIDINLKHMVIK
ncbi:dTDP-4-dehydrorhamnose reductase family protein [Picrophilus oshimae]|uniref:dTDP-4-dehydrorhamnose 3,5-epimerase/dTDP-4-dehydrorhamnose reductase n=1 Tax=Picrophilus torridus (strain ATCC 700027 / DSM 9790 / JCM 10055 / NBRC 100828 / KAW 2/3) TaxID=1122961 RepID=Q6L2A9_PICTO|nr:SDR family oxidoreductase [Picrophilus oshimae]AAT42893.1 dTDP-4-dehydrorhamnose 3,5-epimerase/dTDP-4-dehydrorhamnose reductase [Picrophilus oshimae DSM 9789]